MTNITSAQSTWSEDNNPVAQDETPAESVSTPGQVEKTCSAVGLRRRLALQTNRTFIVFLHDTCNPWAGGNRYPSISAPGVMGFTKSSTHPTSATLATGALVRLEAVRRIGRLRQKSNFINPINAESTVQSPRLKYFTFAVGQIIFRTSRHPVPSRGAYRDRHGRWARGAIDALAAR